MDHTNPGTTDHAADAQLGRDLTALATGIDRFERRASNGQGALDSEGLIPIYIGGDLVTPDELDSHDHALERLDALEQRAQAYPNGPRRTFLIAMIDSLRTATRLFRGDRIDFDEKLRRLVGVPAEPVAPERLQAMRADLEAQLEQAGYRQGTLAEKARRWEEERYLDPGDIEATFTALMSDAQARTDAMVYPTGDYHMALRPVSGVPYTARCNFNTGFMDLNTDLRFTRPALKHLVAHEVFPGHSTQLLYTRDAARTGKSTADVLLCTANTVVGTIQEGIGDQGIHVIDWVETPDERIYIDLRRLRTAAATSAAWYQMSAGWPVEKVRAFLEETCFPQEAWREGRLRFAAHPFRGPFIASYWFGDEAVREVRERAGRENHAAFVAYLYEHMHTPESLRMFEA